MTTKTETTKKPIYKKWWFWLIIAIVTISAINGLNNDNDESAPETEPAATEELVSEDAEEAEAVESTEDAEPEHAEPSQFTFDAYELDSGLNVDTRFEVADNFSKGLIKSGAQRDTVEALQAALAEHPEAQTVWVFGSFPTTDQYGNSDTGDIVQAYYTIETIEKINFDNIDPANIWAVADNAILHPDIQD